MSLYVFAALALVPLLLLQVFARSKFRGQRFVRQGFVTGVVGRKGAGKTLFLVHEILRTLGKVQTCTVCTFEAERELFEKHDRKPFGWWWIRRKCRISHRCYVATNLNLTVSPELEPFLIRLDGDAPFWEAAHAGRLPHNTLHIHDELGVYCPSDPAYRLPKEARDYLKQCRKYGIEIMWSTPHEDDITIGVKRQTDFMGLVGRSPLGISRIKFYHPTELARAKNRAVAASARPKPDHTYSYRVSFDVSRAYNTFQILEGTQYLKESPDDVAVAAQPV